MGMTITEKILARHCGREQVAPGEFINVDVDVALANELSAQLSIVEFEDMDGAETVWDPQKVIIIPDHFTPAKDIRTAELVKKVRAFALKHGVVWYESGTVGIEHVVLLERGFVAPGDVVIGGDSHTVTYGGIGAFATGAGSTDIAAIWALGEFWMRVPESIKIVYTGTRTPWVSAKDIILHTIGSIGVDGAIYGALEYSGPVIETMPAHERFTMANMAIEAGAKSGIVAPDEIAWEYYAAHAGREKMLHKRNMLGDVASDADARYERVVELDISNLEPLVAYPHLPENVRPISEAARDNVRIDQVLLGYCTNGWIEDLRIAAGVLKGRRVAPHTRVLITPGSQEVYLQALKEGLITTFAEAGCVISPSSCGACIGGHLGVIASGERSLTTTNRNFRGRGGALDAEIYLSSPAIAAATAVLGRLGSPEEL
ncbi:MAG TPA: 3-isopropylmalate dehydratase large subunit [Roseiflexaceae bacterium]|nr:3-isopropylmalate dehydratase large subunit [Roseiflexaceae bacterium]